LHLVGAENHRRHQHPNRRIDVVPRPIRPVDPHPNADLCGRAEVAPVEGFLLRGPFGACLVGPLPVGQAGRDHDQTLHEIRSVERQLERDATAERIPDHRGRTVEQLFGVS
jgi:hypothetical protein